MKEEVKKAVGDAEHTEKLIEKLRLYQIILGAVLGFLTAFTPNLVNYVDRAWLNPSVEDTPCGGVVTITSPVDGEAVYGRELDVTGVVNPTGDCQHLFLILSTVKGHNHFITDSVTVNPDGTWDADANLEFIPIGTKVRLQARLCGEADVYRPESCLPALPEKGSRSKTIEILRKGALPKEKPVYTIDGVEIFAAGPRIEVFEFTSIASGRVIGFENPDQYKIVIYGKDSKFGWIKFPFPGHQKGYGWAPIMKDGSWAIELKHRFAQKQNFTIKYKVLLVKKSFEAPDRVKTLDNIPYIASEDVE